ncbi:hypothetical protein BKA66DRAFT_448582 [Pyrenochaeta sp. MPI-SDFR-AT-0127]|nr:hypothetical protein BKA66DRAFT_448582 [Pyrenochaeta sp. MPI-SDFR-AT-0127]
MIQSSSTLVNSEIPSSPLLPNHLFLPFAHASDENLDPSYVSQIISPNTTQSLQDGLLGADAAFDISHIGAQFVDTSMSSCRDSFESLDHANFKSPDLTVPAQGPRTSSLHMPTLDDRPLFLCESRLLEPCIHSHFDPWIPDTTTEHVFHVLEDVFDAEWTFLKKGLFVWAFEHFLALSLLEIVRVRWTLRMLSAEEPD